MKDYSRAVVFCTGPSSLTVPHDLLLHYTGLVIAVNWAVRIGHLIGADYAFFQDGAWLVGLEDCECIISGRTVPVIGKRNHVKMLTRNGRTYALGDMRALPPFMAKAKIYQLAGDPEVGGFQAHMMRLPGANAGFSALNLALHLGAKRIALLGFDCSRAHDAYWKDRQKTPRDHEPRAAWRKWINPRAVAQVGDVWGAQVVNGTPTSYCEAWPRMTAEEAIAWTLR